MTPGTEDMPKAIRILVVDDDADVLENIGAILERRGFAVTTAGSGERALAIIPVDAFDLVITDCHMAPVDGWAVLKAVKETHPLTPVIILTGYGDIDIAVSALRGNADDFIQKPVDSDTLFTRIDICLARKALTERCKTAESALAMTNRAIEAIQVGVAICDAAAPGFPIVFVNKGFEKLTGYAAKDVLGHSMRFLQGDGTDPETVGAIRSALTTGSVYTGDILNYRRNGAPFWNHLTISPVFRATGKIEHFVSTLMDISERKRLETQLRDSDARFRQLSENIDEVFWLVNAEMTRTLFISSTYERMWEHPCDALRRDP